MSSTPADMPSSQPSQSALGKAILESISTLSFGPLVAHACSEWRSVKKYPGFLLIAVSLVAILAWYGTRYWYEQKPYKGKTSIRFFFPGNGQWPEVLESHNIYHWNVFRRDFATDNKAGRNWLIFLIFDHEVNTDKLVLRVHSKVFPSPTTTQSKASGRRGAVLTAAEDFPQGEMELKMEPIVPQQQ